MTLKEFMHTPNLYLDKLAEEAETQRTINEEAVYDSKHTKTKKEIKTMKMKTMVFEVYPEDEYTNRPMWIERNVSPDDDIEDVIMMIQEQGFYVADIVDVYDAEDSNK